MKKSIGWRKINSTVVAAKISLDIPETSLKSTWTEQIQCLHLDGVSHYCDDKQAIGIFATTTTEKISSAPLLARSVSTIVECGWLISQELGFYALYGATC